jgi:sporulation integral membrane protein YtvI
MTSSLFKKFFTALTVAALGWLCLRYLLPIAMPFLLAGLLALAAEPLVSCFHRRIKLPRAVAAGIGVTMTLVILMLILMVLGALAVRQLRALVLVLPDLENSTAEGLQSLRLWLLELAEQVPGSIRPMVENSVQDVFENGNAVMNRVTAWLLGLASGIVTRLPDRALGIGTWLLASYMLSAKFPSIKANLRARLPHSWHEKYLPMLARLKKSVFGWLTAQFKLISITFAVLTVGFFLLGVSHGPLWAVLISLVDALPILGTGTVLIPWSIVCFLQEDTVRAVGILGIYALVMLLRMTLEPKLVGKQLGLDPLVTLAAMYTGYRLWGVLGMLFAPLLAVAARQLFTTPQET